MRPQPVGSGIVRLLCMSDVIGNQALVAGGIFAGDDNRIPEGCMFS
jgi:hypothetical protein